VGHAAAAAAGAAEQTPSHCSQCELWPLYVFMIMIMTTVT